MPRTHTRLRFYQSIKIRSSRCAVYAVESSSQKEMTIRETCFSLTHIRCDSTAGTMTTLFLGLMEVLLSVALDLITSIIWISGITRRTTASLSSLQNITLMAICNAISEAGKIVVHIRIEYGPEVRYPINSF